MAAAGQMRVPFHKTVHHKLQSSLSQCMYRWGQNPSWKSLFWTSQGHPSKLEVDSRPKSSFCGSSLFRKHNNLSDISETYGRWKYPISWPAIMQGANPKVRAWRCEFSAEAKCERLSADSDNGVCSICSKQCCCGIFQAGILQPVCIFLVPQCLGVDN